MTEHLNDFNKIITDLLNLDVTINEDKALLLLNALPESYEFLVTIVLHGLTDIVFEDVSNALMNNEVRKKEKETYQDSSTNVLTARGRTSTWKKSECGKSQSKSRGRYDNWRKLDKNECAYCRQKDHWKKDCPILEEKGLKSNVVRDDDTDTYNALTISLSVSQTSEWILDSGCSYHMCPNKEMFLDFKEFNGGVVYMSNDSTCKMMGVGSVQIKMFDGVIQKLNDVRYVPDLKKI